MIRVLLLLVCVTFSFNVAGAGIFKWIDKDGQVHYGDRPISKNAEAMDAQALRREPPPSEVESVHKRREELQRILKEHEERRAKKKEKRAQQQAQRELERRKCGRWRGRRNFLIGTPNRTVWTTHDMDGNLVGIPYDRILKERAEADEEIERWCGR